jgi:biopolymer transport protein ExbD
MAFGRLERNTGPKPMADINMTPLIDVMLVLLVIFIITAPLMVSSVKLNLPQAQGASASTAPKSIAIAIDASGQIYGNEQPVTLDALASALHSAAQANPATEVQLRADAAVPYGRVVEVMGLAQKEGLSRIGFVAERSPKMP